MKTTFILLLFTLHFVVIKPSYSQVWQNMGLGFGNNNLFDLHYHNNEIYACGPILFSGTTYVNGIAKWNGSSWLPLQNGTSWGVPYTMTSYNGELIAGGMFQNIQGCVGCRKIARWDGADWHNLNNGITNGTIESMTVFNGDLYVGGSIQSVDSIPMKHLARWDGSDWYPVCTFSGGLSQLFCMTVFNNELYIGGYFWSLNGNTMYNIARFDGTTWSDVGGGTGGIVSAMYPDTVNNRLYVSGNIVHVNNGTTPCPSNVAYWDGAIWHPVGNGPQLTPKELGMFKNELYVGFGSFPVNSSGDTLACIARWDGNDWQSVGGGVNCNVHAFLPYGNDLIVGGCFTQAGDSAVSLIAVWKDTTTSVSPSPEMQEAVKIIPNPFSNTAMVQLPDGFHEKFPLSFILTDLNGKIVLEKRVAETKFEISREHLVAGIYLYRLRNRKKLIDTGKVVIE